MLREDGQTGHGTYTYTDRSNSVIFGVPFKLQRVRNFLLPNENTKNKNFDYINYKINIQSRTKHLSLDTGRIGLSGEPVGELPGRQSIKRAMTSVE